VFGVKGVLVAIGVGVSLVSGCGVQDAVAGLSGNVTDDSDVGAWPVETTRVERVVDGDTLVVAGNRKVRVLGIDSCEMDTPGGKRAREEAQSLLLGRTVVLSRENQNTDGYGRLLRYVRMGDGGDFGQTMVLADHTGVYEGGAAGKYYVAELRELDKGVWKCD
jgi:micrococcal nuclease